MSPGNTVPRLSRIHQVTGLGIILCLTRKLESYYHMSQLKFFNALYERTFSLKGSVAGGTRSRTDATLGIRNAAHAAKIIPSSFVPLELGG